MSHKILVVDDELSNRKMIGYALHSAGHSVSAAESGKEALLKIQAEIPDLVILDVMMPGMDGIEVCERLRNNPETATLPIIMLSALAQVNEKIRGLKAGADDYLTKPIDPKELVARVEALLERSRRLRQAQSVKEGSVIGVVGVKGGVGATTVAVNVATAFAEKQKNVAIAEIRSTYGTLSSHLHLHPTSGVTSLFDLGQIPISEKDIKKQLIALPSGLKVLLGPQNFGEYRGLESQHTESMVEGLTSLVELVVLDIPSNLTVNDVGIMGLCNYVLLVVEPEQTCLAAGKVLRELLADSGIAEQSVSIVIVNRAASTMPVGQDEVGAQIGYSIIGYVPPATDALIAALKFGVPIVQHQPKALISKAFRDISEKLLEQIVVTE